MVGEIIMNYIYIGIIVLLVLCIIGIMIYYYYKEKMLLKKLNKMIDDVINNNFKENIYDESMLSSVEARLSQYLSMCNTSVKSLSDEKIKIKELISDISHQTKTPIANILLYSQLLNEQNISKESEDCVVELSLQAEKLSFLIDSLIKTSRLETGIVTLNPKKNDIYQMLVLVYTQILKKAQLKNIDIRIEKTSQFAIFDNKWTVEAIYNIVDNAVKYTNENGMIELSVTPYQLFCKIDIKDNGMGIADDEQSKIFKRFYRSQSVNQVEGVGIGLFLSREIISRQGGYIKVKSQLGKGSVFSVYLPM